MASPIVEHEVEEVIKIAEERTEVAAVRGFLGGPQMWGLLALAVVIVILLIFYHLRESACPCPVVEMTVNGKAVSADVEDRTLLVELLREHLRLTGTHIGCDTSQCGACLVLVDGVAVKSCTMLAARAAGARVTTIEGLSSGPALHPMQQAFHENHGLQCGFCTPGMIISGIDMVRRYGTSSTRRPSATSSKAISAAAPAIRTSSSRSQPAPRRWRAPASAGRGGVRAMYETRYHRPKPDEAAALFAEAAEAQLPLRRPDPHPHHEAAAGGADRRHRHLRAIAEMKGIAVHGDTVVDRRRRAPMPRSTRREAVKQAFRRSPTLAGMIGDPAVREMGTIGGSLANNDPAADYPAAVLALGATVHTDKRSIAAAEFFAGLFATALEEGEIVTRRHLPDAGGGGLRQVPQPGLALCGGRRLRRPHEGWRRPRRRHRRRLRRRLPRRPTSSRRWRGTGRRRRSMPSPSTRPTCCRTSTPPPPIAPTSSR